MKNKIWVIIVLFFLSFSPSCKKKTYNCSYPVYYIRPVDIAFVGFTENELDTVLIAHYKEGVNFSEFLGRDTLVSQLTNMLVYDDTIYRNDTSTSYSGFGKLAAGVDDSVIVPSTGSVFTITGTSSDIVPTTYTSEAPCLDGRSSVLPFNNIHINGMPHTAEVTQRVNNELNAFIYLKK